MWLLFSLVFRVHLWAGGVVICCGGSCDIVGVAIFWKWGGGVVVVVEEIIITIFIHQIPK